MNRCLFLRRSSGRQLISYSTKAAKKRTKPFPVLQIPPTSDASKAENAKSAAVSAAEEHLRLLARCQQGGGEKARQRHEERNKKVFVRDRLRAILDDYDGDFLELGSTSGMGLDYGDIPFSGMVAGIGPINGVHCLILANDATVKGTHFWIHQK